jgi:hypothetical protein
MANEEECLSEVWYVPDIKKYLFSVLASQDKNTTSEFRSRALKCSLIVNDEEIVTGHRKRFGGLYHLNIKTVIPTDSVEVQTTTSEDMLQLYHERLGHQNKRHVKNVVLREMGIKLELNQNVCEGCQYGKAHRLKFGTRDRATKPAHLIHSDVCGPFEASNSNYRYF